MLKKKKKDPSKMKPALVMKQLLLTPTPFAICSYKNKSHEKRPSYPSNQNNHPPSSSSPFLCPQTFFSLRLDPRTTKIVPIATTSNPSLTVPPPSHHIHTLSLPKSKLVTQTSAMRTTTTIV